MLRRTLIKGFLSLVSMLVPTKSNARDPLPVCTGQVDAVISEDDRIAIWISQDGRTYNLGFKTTNDLAVNTRRWKALLRSHGHALWALGIIEPLHGETEEERKTILRLLHKTTADRSV